MDTQEQNCWLPWLPVAVATNYLERRGLKQHRFITSKWILEVRSPKPTSLGYQRGVRGWFLWRLQGESGSCLFQLLQEAAMFVGLWPHHSNLCFIIPAPRLTLPTSPPPHTPLISALVITLNSDNSTSSSHLKVLNLITPAESLWLWKVTHPQVLGVNGVGRRSPNHHTVCAKAYSA